METNAIHDPQTGALRAMTYCGFDDGRLPPEAKRMDVYTAYIEWPGDVSEEIDVLALNLDFAQKMVAKELKRNYVSGGTIAKLSQRERGTLYM